MGHKLTIREAKALTRHMGRRFEAGDEINETLTWTFIGCLLDVEAFKEDVDEPDVSTSAGTPRHEPRTAWWTR